MRSGSLFENEFVEQAFHDELEKLGFIVLNIVPPTKGEILTRAAVGLGGLGLVNAAGGAIGHSQGRKMYEEGKKRPGTTIGTVLGATIGAGWGGTGYVIGKRMGYSKAKREAEHHR